MSSTPAMPDTPEGARLKFGRAREHVIAQQAETRRAIEAERAPFDFRIDDDPNSDSRVVIAVSHLAPLPARIGLLIGGKVRNRPAIVLEGGQQAMIEPLTMLTALRSTG